MLDIRLYPVAGAMLAAVGQIFLKLGANGASAFSNYLNWRVAAGLVCYVMGALVWLVALSRLPLSRVYPYAILTFVLVYVASIFFLGEQMSLTLFVGVFFVLVGLVLVNFA